MAYTRLQIKLFVVIPTLDEAANISVLLERLSETPGIYEIVVVDGGSTTATPNILRSSMYRLVLGEPSRGIQFRVGASETTGDVLLFASRRLAAPECGHADSECYGGGLRWWNFCLRYSRDDLLGR